MSDPLEYLFSLEQFGIKFGLDNIRTLVEALGHPERTFRAIHVAGTNGKGSVTALAESVLRSAGYRTGRYTSPHLVDLTERFAINGRPIAEPALRATVEAVRHTIQSLRAKQVLEGHPTFFEVTTACAFELFRQAGVEVAVCEVGLGGRLDATNVLSPMVCAITSIAFDHEQYLGSSLAQIAAEKAGIIKPGVPVVVGDLPGEAEEVVRRVAAERSAPLVHAARVAIADGRETSDGHQSFAMRSALHDYGRVTLRLAGVHQQANARVAVALLEEAAARGMTIPVTAVADGFANVAWPGRLEHLTFADGRSALLDAAHNPAGAEVLANYLRAHGTPRPLVFTAMRDKDARAILGALIPVVSALVLTKASSHRSAEPADLAELARAIDPDISLILEPSPAAALERAWQLHPHVVVAGSIFLLGDIMKALGRA